MSHCKPKSKSLCKASLPLHRQACQAQGLSSLQPGGMCGDLASATSGTSLHHQETLLMPRQMVVLGPGALAGEGSAKRGFSPCLPPELPSRTLPWSVPSWPAVSCLWDGTTFALLAGSWNSEQALDWPVEMSRGRHTWKPARAQRGLLWGLASTPPR